MKIDVEGHEHRTLAGMPTLIERNRPVIVMEILAANNRSEHLADVLPAYEFFGSRTGLASGITKSAYSFCRFRYGVTYMSGLFIPREKIHGLARLLPRR